jgi:hypothetical protein
MTTAWVCDCTHINHCDDLDLRPGRVVQCTNCNRIWVQAVLRRGAQVWLQVSENDVKLHDPMRPNPHRQTSNDRDQPGPIDGVERLVSPGQGEP